MPLTGRALVTAMCAGQVGNLLPHVVVPAIMAAHLIPLWGLSAAQAGLMAGAYAFGYMLAVPLLATLTDRIDARLVLIFGSALSGVSTAAFGLFANGLVAGGIGDISLRQRLDQALLDVTANALAPLGFCEMRIGLLQAIGRSHVVDVRAERE